LLQLEIAKSKLVKERVCTVTRVTAEFDRSYGYEVWVSEFGFVPKVRVRSLQEFGFMHKVTVRSLGLFQKSRLKKVSELRYALVVWVTVTELNLSMGYGYRPGLEYGYRV